MDWSATLDVVWEVGAAASATDCGVGTADAGVGRFAWMPETLRMSMAGRLSPAGPAPDRPGGPRLDDARSDRDVEVLSAGRGGVAARRQGLLALLRLLVLGLDLLTAILFGLLGLLVRVGSPCLLQGRRPAA
ncbi:protein of unknown function (plasmid) [Azospirillum baldaniorum]|uniref:Uncharacterized protein n=1 Tax=Azospirillum baldaniorum TaxID=1064539 RepID=A0A9P1JVH6_9PROT|nr:protein of unknown function [Azospirillum baldaniorum]